MNKLSKVKLFRILSETSQVSNSKIQHSYEDFLAELLTLNQSEVDYPTAFRVLNFTRIEFVTLQLHCRYEQGGKCLKRSLFTESYFCY